MTLSESNYKAIKELVSLYLKQGDRTISTCVTVKNKLYPYEINFAEIICELLDIPYQETEPGWDCFFPFRYKAMRLFEMSTDENSVQEMIDFLRGTDWAFMMEKYVETENPARTAKYNLWYSKYDEFVAIWDTKRKDK